MGVLKILLLVLITFHGLIHILGFVKAFRIAPVQALSHDISKANGMLWLLSCLLFLLTASIFFSGKEWWWLPSIAALVVSQYVMIKDWSDAKYGSIANGLMLIITIIGFIVWCIVTGQ